MAKKILVVDDEPDILKVTIFRLQKLGYQVVTAVDGEEALHILHTDTPDLVLLDLLLPKVSGDDICKRIKSDERLRKVPVILFTASTSLDVSLKAQELGADDFLTKPFDSEVLLEKVRRFIG